MAQAGRVRVLDFPVDAVDLAGAVRAVLGLVEARPAGRTRLVVTVNPEILLAAARDPLLARVLTEADLVVPDGIGVVWASRLLGRPLPERVPGIDLMQRLLAEAAARGLGVYLLGARPEVIAAAAAEARRRFPGLRLLGYRDGYFGPEEEARVAAAVREAAPDLLFAGMGAERELKWLYRHRERLGAAVAMGVGGSFDVLSGRLRRAPPWMRRYGLEWLYRLWQEPSRWRRQLALPRFALRVLAEALAAPRGGWRGDR